MNRLVTALRSYPVVAALLLSAAPALGQQPKKVDVLHIGTTGTLAPGKEESALSSLQSFIKDETGLNNDINRQKGWQELAERMAKGELHVGVFQGFEFAWATEKHPNLKPLALAVNVYQYPTAYIIARRDAGLKGVAGLQGKAVEVPVTGAGYLRFYLDRQAEAAGKPAEQFFSQVTKADNAEDALDDVVDGKVQATVVDKATLEGYKRRKPQRFNQLAPAATSQPFPPTVIAVYGNVLDDKTQQQFRQGLLNAGSKERGKITLNMFRLTSFDAPPAGFAKVLAETRKNYPPSPAKGG